MTNFEKENPMDEAFKFVKITICLFVLSLALTVMTFMDNPFFSIFMLASPVFGATYSFKAIRRLGDVKDPGRKSLLKKTMLMFFAVITLLLHLFTICFLFYVIFIMDYHWDFG